MKIKILCTTCNKEFERERKYVTPFKSHFCSKECQSKFKTQTIECTCATCGRVIQRKLSILNRSKTGNVYCSRSCATTNNNKLFKIKKDSSTFISKAYRKKALNHYGAKCSLCGYCIEQCLEVHHKDLNRDNNSIENLIVLCPNCHKEVHNNLKSI